MRTCASASKRFRDFLDETGGVTEAVEGLRIDLEFHMATFNEAT